MEFKHFTNIQIYQFLANDSSKSKITYSAKLNPQGKIIAEYYKDYKTDSGNGRADVLTKNEYDKSGKIIISTNYYTGSFMSDEIQKTFYYYSDTLLTRIEAYEFKKRLKKDIDKGLSRPGGCIITPDDYEKERTWELARMQLFQYNNQGKKVKSYSPVSQGSHNGFEYSYNDKGELLTEKSFDKDKLLYTERYEYKNTVTTSVLTWDSHDWGSTKRIFTRDQKNKKLLKEQVIQGENEYVHIYIYNLKGQLVKYIAYDSLGKINLTHIYKYK